MQGSSTAQAPSSDMPGVCGAAVDVSVVHWRGDSHALPSHEEPPHQASNAPRGFVAVLPSPGAIGALERRSAAGFEPAALSAGACFLDRRIQRVISVRHELHGCHFVSRRRVVACDHPPVALQRFEVRPMRRGKPHAQVQSSTASNNLTPQPITVGLLDGDAIARRELRRAPWLLGCGVWGVSGCCHGVAPF